MSAGRTPPAPPEPLGDRQIHVAPLPQVAFVAERSIARHATLPLPSPTGLIFRCNCPESDRSPSTVAKSSRSAGRAPAEHPGDASRLSRQLAIHGWAQSDPYLAANDMLREWLDQEAGIGLSHMWVCTLAATEAGAI